jgi:hypothetical protein
MSVNSIKIPPAFVTSFEFNPSEFSLAAVTSARTVRIWGELESELGMVMCCWELVWSGGGGRCVVVFSLAAETSARTVRIWGELEWWWCGGVVWGGVFSLAAVTSARTVRI